LAGAHHDRVVDLALLDLAARDRILHRHLDDVADAGVTSLGAAEHLDAPHFLGAGVVGHVEVALHLDHGSASSYSAARETISTTRQFLVLDIGAISTTRTVSPSLQEFSASWACSLLERRMYLPYSACLTWRSTRTVTVLSILLLTTRPSTVRSFLSVFSVIVGLPYFCAPACWPSRVFTRAISRRTRRASWVLSSWPVAFCMRRENCSLCSSTRCACSSSADFSRSSLMVAMSAHRPGHELGGNRELGGGQAESLARGRLVDALDLVDHA